jgi:methionyl-tRNA formyltransferase
LKYKVSYIGNYYKVAEMLLFNKDVHLVNIICEKQKVSEDLVTFSLVRNIKLILIENKDDLIKSLIEINSKIDFFIMCSFGKRIPVEDLKGIRIFNIHYSLLPNYKGRHPTFWATVSGEKEIGISIHTVTEKIDEGEIIGQEKVPYYLWMNEIDLFEELTLKIPILIRRCIDYLENRIKAIPNKKGHYFPIVTEEDITLNIYKDTYEVIYNKVRAQAKYKGAKLLLGSNIFWLRNIKFIYYNLDQEFVINNEGSLLVRINDGICLKSDSYDIEKEVIL